MSEPKAPTRGQLDLAHRLVATIPGLTLTRVLAAFAAEEHAQIIAWKYRAAILTGTRPNSGRGVS